MKTSRFGQSRTPCVGLAKPPEEKTHPCKKRPANSQPSVGNLFPLQRQSLLSVLKCPPRAYSPPPACPSLEFASNLSATTPPEPTLPSDIALPQSINRSIRDHTTWSRHPSPPATPSPSTPSLLKRSSVAAIWGRRRNSTWPNETVVPTPSTSDEPPCAMLRGSVSPTLSNHLF